eukprot:m.240522 g.240522  ORF g.240522 m.240522 type:complete len:253 (+) comp15329_c0_seq1:78-836(+)
MEKGDDDVVMDAATDNETQAKAKTKIPKSKKKKEKTDSDHRDKTDGNNKEKSDDDIITTKNNIKETKKLTKGIIYFSTIPLHMKPMKVKHLMQKYGEVDRIFLQPEDPRKRRQRIKNGGSKKVNYTEGWVEFKDKRIAKRVAQMLNGKIVGGKKNNFHHDFLWNMKYLKKFKWHHLTEQMAYEKAQKEQRIGAELKQIEMETDTYVQQVEKTSRIHHAMEKIDSGKRAHKEEYFTHIQQRHPIKRSKDTEEK